MRPTNFAYIRICSFAVVLVLLCAIGAPAQTDRASLTGTITDPSGALIPGASVDALNVDTQIHYQGETNSSGVYRLSALPVGNYTVTVSHPGFKSAESKGVALQVGETRTLDVRLAIGEVAERVEVNAEITPYERSSAEAGEVISGVQVQNLPVNGRDWNTLEMLAPWAQDDGGGDMRTIRFAGRARDDNYFSFDGIDATGIQEQAQKSSVRLQVSEDAIQEFRVSSALYTAEYGSQAGGQVNVVTKSGTNDFHGSAFGYLRNSTFDARTFLDPAKIPPFRLGQYGLTFGGPIKKDKTFFFLSYEGLRQLQGTTLLAAVPDPALQRQILTTSPALCPIMQAWPWRASTAAIGSCAPKFTFPDVEFTDLGSAGSNIDNFVHERDTVLHEDSWLVRFDHKFTDKTSFYGRAQRDISLLTAPLGNALDEQAVFNHPANYLLALVHVFSPNLVNESKFGVNRSPFLNPQLCAMPLAPGQVCPAVNTTNFESLNNSNADHEIGTTLSYIDNLTLNHGRQTFKTGIEIRRIRLNQGITFDNLVEFLDSGDNSSLINNQVSDVQYFGSWCCHGLRRTLVMPYFQDEWKVTPTFTANLGFRWEYYGVANEAHNRTVVFDLQQFKGACVGSGETRPAIRALESTAVTCPANPTLYPPNYRNFDPRISFAWAPSALHEKTVIRTGFGIYHGAAQNDDLNAALESDNSRVLINSTPGTQQLVFDSGYFNASPASFKATPAPVSAIATGQDPRALFRNGRRDLYVEQWGLTIDQALPGNLLFSSSYFGSHGARLFARSLENTCDPATYLSTGNCVRALDNVSAVGGKGIFGEVDFKQDVGTSSYHGLLLSLQRRMTNGLSFQTKYTFSHSINDGSVGGGESNTPENVQCRACDRGPSIYDIRHNVIVNTVYELPIGPGKPHLNGTGFWGKLAEGWSISGLGSWHTGHPLTILFSPDSSQLPDQNTRSDERPDIVPGVSLVPPGGQTSILWINPAAFTTPPSELNPLQDPTSSCFPKCIIYTRYGNAPRGIVRAPGVWSIDTSIAKTSKLTERLAMQMRLDVFNIFNHTQLGDPGTLDFQAGDFGRISTTVNFNNNNDNLGATNTGTGLPRQLQLSLRFTF